MTGQYHALNCGGNMIAPHVWDHVLNQKPALLLHFDGADAATATTDSGGTGHTINFNGTAQLDTDQSKFFGSSLLLDGDSDYLDIDDHADWDISTNFTIDLWAKHTDHALYEIYLEQREDADNHWYFLHRHGYGLRFVINSGGGAVVLCDYGGEITDTDWHHVAMCKVGNEYGLYKDGTQYSHKSDASIDAFAGSLYIGCDGAATPANHFQGHLDEIRIVKANVFNAAPVAGLTDKITVPCLPYTSWR